MRLLRKRGIGYLAVTYIAMVLLLPVSLYILIALGLSVFLLTDNLENEDGLLTVAYP